MYNLLGLLTQATGYPKKIFYSVSKSLKGLQTSNLQHLLIRKCDFKMHNAVYL